MSIKSLAQRYLPILSWGAEYDRRTFTSDLIAAAIVSIMLIPQSLAYALLVGVPPQVGLYASMAPLVLYAIFGTSRALAVGPVAVASLMTAAAAGRSQRQTRRNSWARRSRCRRFPGCCWWRWACCASASWPTSSAIRSCPASSRRRRCRSRRVNSARCSASAPRARACSKSCIRCCPASSKINPTTAAIGIVAVVFLLWARRGLKPLLLGVGLGERAADILSKVAPAMVIVAATLAVWGFDLQARNVAILGTVPGGLPTIALPPIDVSLWTKLLVPSLLICIVGYVESISVALTLAAKRRQRVDPDQELIALGAADLGSAVSGGFPVTGALSRSVVNFDAGAQTPAAGAFTAVGVAIATLFLTPLLFILPKAALAAIIIVAVLSLVDLRALKHTWDYSRADFAAMAATILVTWLDGVEAGLMVGVGLSIFLHLYETSRPHVAVVGQIPGNDDLSQRGAPRGGDRSGNSFAAHRREPLLPERPLHRGTGQRFGGGQSGGPPRHPRMPGGEYDRRLGAREPGGDQQPALRRRDHLSPIRGKGTGDGPTQALALPQELSGKVHLSHFDAVSSIKPELAASVLAARRVRS